jgi:OmcA/MtrC family decaheme c-type cytochrome
MRLALVVLVLAGGVALISGEKPAFTERDKAFYADEALINFVRPGLVFKVQNYSIGADGTVKVQFSMTDPKGVGLDRDGILTPGTVSSSFILARVPKSSRYFQSYTTRVKTSTDGSGKTATQAAADTGGSYSKVSDGVYMYTFGTKLPGNYDKDALTTVGIYGSRNLTEFDMGTNYASTTFNFVPDGSAGTPLRDVIRWTSCSKCHADDGFHGGSRRGMDMCVLCHTPAYGNISQINPETGNSFDMEVMAHKIHMGRNLPSVIAGKPYQLIRNQTAISDFSDVNIPSEPVRCYFCHETKNEAAAQKANWYNYPSIDACGACHDNVDFKTGKNHAGGLPQPDSSKCSQCHIAQGDIDFDNSVKGAHTQEFETTLISGLKAEIKSVTNTQAGQKPTVVYTIKKNNGQPWKMADLNRCALVLSGPTTDYSSPTSVGYVSEDCKAVNPPLNGDTYQYNFATAIPAGSKGTWTIGIEARVFETVLAGTPKERSIEYGADNKVVNFSVDGGAVVPRRTIVTTATCNGCHKYLSLHGTNRNQIEQCVLCHNPLGTDAARRTAALMPAEGIDLNLMIHRIHTGTSQTRPYVIYGFGNSKNDFSEVAFPTSASNCAMCHVNNTQTLVPAQGILSKTDPRGYLNPVTPTTAACLSCHTSKDAASHALANTTTLGESCGACHGPSSEFSVAKVHAQ